LQAIGQFGQGLVNQVRSIGNQVSDNLAGSVGQATGTLAQGAFQGLGAGLGQLGQGMLNPNMRLANPASRVLLAGQSDGSGDSSSSSSSGGGDDSGGSSGGGSVLVREALAGGASIFPEAAVATAMGSSSSSDAEGMQTRTLLHFDRVAAAGSAGDLVIASSTMGSSDGSGSSGGSSDGSSGGSTRSLQQVDFFAAPMALNNFVNEGVTSGSFGTQLGQGELNGQFQAGLSALAGSGTGIGADVLGAGGNAGGLGQLARLAGLGGLGGNAADPFNAGGGNGALGGLGGILSSVVGGGGSGGAAKKKGGGLGGLLSGIAHGFGAGRSSGTGGSDANSAVGAASLAGAQYGSGTDGSTMYSPYSQQQGAGGTAGYILEQGSLGGAQQGPAAAAAAGQNPQQSAYMQPDLYNQAFQQLQKVPGQAVGALTGYGLGLANQGLQTTQNLGNQMFQQVGENLANGNPVVGGNNQPMVVQGLGQDPNTYVIGGSDYYPGGNGAGQVQQFNQVPAGPGQLVSGQMTPATNQRGMFGGGQLGSGGQFVTQSTQPVGVIDPATGEAATAAAAAAASRLLLLRGQGRCCFCITTKSKFSPVLAFVATKPATLLTLLLLLPMLVCHTGQYSSSSVASAPNSFYWSGGYWGYCPPPAPFLPPTPPPLAVNPGGALAGAGTGTLAVIRSPQANMEFQTNEARGLAPVLLDAQGTQAGSQRNIVSA
jgi:hypothetical protein